MNGLPAEMERRKRLIGLDLLRGSAVLLMIEQHLGVWLWDGYADPALEPYLIGFNAMGIMAAPLFIFLAGAGVSLMQDRTAPRLIVRGLFLIACGYSLNFLTPSWFSWGSWFVLHLIGFAIIVSAFAARFPQSVLLAAAVLLICAAAPVQNWLDTPLFLPNARLRNLNLPGGALRLATAEGQFPIVPWLGVFLSGMACGRWLSERRSGPIALCAVGFLIIGSVLAGIYFFSPIPQPPLLLRFIRIGLGFYPASPSLVLLLTGLAMALTAAVGLLTPRGFWPTDSLASLGRVSLSLFFFHIVLFREGGARAGVLDAVPTAATLLLIFLVCTGALAASGAWSRCNYRCSLEWCMRQIERAIAGRAGSLF